MTVKRWPTIPRTIEGLAGPIRVVVRRGVESFKAKDGDDCLGLYQPVKRRIDIAGKVPPALRWHTLIHEWTHSVLLDCGAVNLIHGVGIEHERNVEVFSDTFATALLRAGVQQFGVDPWPGAKR